MYKSFYDNHVGSGALVNRISQLRDPYLDIRYRNASTETYHYDTWLSGLQSIASILDEVGKGDNKDGLIYKAIQDLAEKLRSYSANPTSLNDRLVRNSAESLTLLFHSAADRLEKLYNETVNEFHEDVTAVNGILTNIRDLNKSIREAEIHGDTALEMRDERNRQIDALSQYLDIKVEYSYENIGGGVEVEKLTIKLNDANPDSTVHTDESILVDGVFATQLSVPKEKPVLASTYGDQYFYLKNFTYLKKIAANEDALKKYFDENGLKLEDFLVKETGKDGKQYYIVGTDDQDEAVWEDQPVPNKYADANTDDYCWYMEGYQYIKKIKIEGGEDELYKYLEENARMGLKPDMPDDILMNPLKSEDGLYYIVGTNDPGEALMEYRPVDNTYDDAYLKDYQYIKKIDVNDTEALEQYLADNPITLTDLLMSNNPYVKDPETDEIYFLFGTNDPDVKGIYTEPNDNFTIQLGKLLNSKGEEWKNTTTAWVEVTAAEVAANAKFAYTVSADFPDDGGSFIIVDADGEEHEFTIGDKNDVAAGTVTLDTVRNSAAFAGFLADAFKQLNKYPGYDIEAVGDRLVFTANPDAKPAPASPPILSVTDESNSGLITASERKTIPDIEYDEHGNMTKSVNYVQINGTWYQLTIGNTYTHEVTLDDNDLRGILQAQRELLTEEGEFSSAKDVIIDESALSKRGIPYYIKSLDLLAQKFAEAYNQLNSGYACNQDGNYIDSAGYPLMLEDASTNPPERKPVSADGLTPGQRQYLINTGYFLQDKAGNAIDEDGNIITDAHGNPITADTIKSLSEADYGKLTVDFDRWMKEKDAIPMGGTLFTNLDGETTKGITAKTISISNGWGNGLWNLVPTFTMLFADDGSGGLTHSTQNDNADHMVAMIDKALTYNPRDLDGSDAIGPQLFSGSFNDMLSNMMAKEGEDASITNVRLTNAATSLTELDYSREGVSGVDLNDEAMNMITYSKAMSAAMRVMTVIDEMLDRLINNTAI